MTAFIAISSVISDEDVQDIVLDLINGGASSSFDASQKLIICAQQIKDVNNFAKLPVDKVTLHELTFADSEVLCACVEFIGQVNIQLRLVLNEIGEKLPVLGKFQDVLSLGRIEQLLMQGQYKAVIVVASAVRKDLQSRGTLLCASLAEALREIILYAECQEKTQTPVFSDSGKSLHKRGIDVDVHQFLRVYSDALNAFQGASPALEYLVSEQTRFVNQGIALANVAFRKKNQKFDFFVWLAIYFLRLSGSRLSRSDCAEALSLSTRALECYAIYYLTLPPEIFFEGGAFYWRSSGNKVAGTGELLTRLEARLDSMVSNQLRFELDLCREAIELRNRSVFGHGIQKLKGDELSIYTSAIKKVIEGIESQDSASASRWRELWQKSCPTTIRVVSDLVSRIIPKSIKYGGFLQP